MGLGTVGSGVYESLLQKQDVLISLFGEEVRVVCILVKNGTKERREHEGRALITTSFTEFMSQSPDVVFEAIGGIDPAYTYVRVCLEKKIPVITANKALISQYGGELHHLAERFGTYLAYEASVAGGIPVLHSLKHQLKINRVLRITGILNGTTNYILTRMTEQQLQYEQALQEAQTLGYAEADPTDDVEGWDALYKLQILTSIATQRWSSNDPFYRKGIKGIRAWHIALAQKLGMCVKLLARLTIDDQQVEGTVEPVWLPQTHPLAGIHGVTNALTIEGDLVGELTFQGPGAGKLPTASAMIEDFAYYHPRWIQERERGGETRLFSRDLSPGYAGRDQRFSQLALQKQDAKSRYAPGQSVWLVYKDDHPLVCQMDEWLKKQEMVTLFSYKIQEGYARLVQTPSTFLDWKHVFDQCQIDWYAAWLNEDEWVRLAELENEWLSRKARPTAFAI